MKRREFFAANLGAVVVPCIGADERAYDEARAEIIRAINKIHLKHSPIPWSDKPFPVLADHFNQRMP